MTLSTYKETSHEPYLSHSLCGDSNITANHILSTPSQDEPTVLVDLSDSRTGRVANHRRAYVHLIDELPRLIGFGEPVSNSFFPVRYDILMPYLVLFFGSILLMKIQTRVTPWWAALIVWGVVNLVNLLQAVGFLSRVATGNREINHLLGYGIVALGIPSILTVFAFVRVRAGLRQLIGPLVFLFFLVFMIFVEYIWQVEFRSPVRNDILVPYLVLFFGSILLMGLPMFRMNRQLWLVTVATTVLLLVSMVFAMYMGVG